MNFACTGQCLALVGPLAGSDYATLKWTFQWNGVVGYGFLVGQQIAPGETVQVNGESSVDQLPSSWLYHQTYQIHNNQSTVFASYIVLWCSKKTQCI
jgi:hypothetical protein